MPVAGVPFAALFRRRRVTANIQELIDAVEKLTEMKPVKLLKRVVG